MKTKSYILALFLPLFFLSCQQIAPYKTSNVTIEMSVRQCSAGFAEVNFITSKNAYFLCGIIPLEPGQTKPYTDSEHFMVMQLDSAQIEYMKWRHQLLNDNVPYIATFADHALDYGTTDEYFLRLDPNTSYFVYAFVVDIETNQPVGDLFSTVITTRTFSDVNIAFNYRINSDWDYIYPVDSNGLIISNHPYNALTFSSDSLRYHLDHDSIFSDLIDTLRTPVGFFTILYSYSNLNIINPIQNSLFIGIRSANHSGDDDEEVPFVAGQTYYTGIASADGFPTDHQIDVYKFVWTGHTMQRKFSCDKDTLGLYEW